VPRSPKPPHADKFLLPEYYANCYILQL